MDDNGQSAHDLLGKLREDLLKRQLSNTENYDKSVLSLATTFLGFSLAFVKDFVPIQFASLAWLLPASWALFGMCIISTILSFFASQAGLKKQLFFAEKYYLEGDESFFNKKNMAANLTDYLNYLSAIFFISAVVATVLFTSINLTRGKDMTTKPVVAMDRASIPSMVQKGATIPSMQNVVPLGAQIPAMQQVSSPQPASQPSPQPSPTTVSGK
jgi:hypothetical protein